MVKAWVRHDHPYAVHPGYPYIHTRLPQIGNLDDDMNSRHWHCSTRKRTSRKKTVNGGSRSASQGSTAKQNGIGTSVEGDPSSTARDTKIHDYFTCHNERQTKGAPVPSSEQHSEVDVPCPNAAALPIGKGTVQPPSPQLGEEPLQTPWAKPVCEKTAVDKHQKPRKGSKVPGPQPNKQENAKTAKKTEVLSHALTEYFPIRRSVRKTRTVLKKEKQKHVEELILSGSEEGFAVVELNDKGRGVITTKHVRSGEFVLEYAGELIEVHEAKEREQLYAKDDSIGCYMYYFMCRNKHYCIDATKETDRLGRLVNHSKKGNLKTQTCIVQGIPRLVLVAQRDIDPGEELLYDYGDRSRSSLQSYPWLAL